MRYNDPRLVDNARYIIWYIPVFDLQKHFSSQN